MRFLGTFHKSTANSVFNFEIPKGKKVAAKAKGAKKSKAIAKLQKAVKVKGMPKRTGNKKATAAKKKPKPLKNKEENTVSFDDIL